MRRKGPLGMFCDRGPVVHGQSRQGTERNLPRLVLWCATVAWLLILPLVGCQSGATETPIITPTVTARPPTRTTAPTPSDAAQETFLTFARGELLPDMRVPIQRSATGEGGWYTVIGTADGWDQFLSRMGQPAEIWESVQWEEEILIGALLGVRQGRGYGITIADLSIEDVTVSVEISFSRPSPDQTPPSWITSPFHFVRVPRLDLPLGPVTFRFLSTDDAPSEPESQLLVSQDADMIDLDILWLPGEEAAYPTPTPIPSTSTPEPTPTSTPAPHLQVTGTVLDVVTDQLRLRILSDGGDWQTVDLMEATSILFQDGQSATLAQLVPGTMIGVLGYPEETGAVRAAHIDVLSLPADESFFAQYRPRNVTLSTLYDGAGLPIVADEISATLPLTQTFNVTQTRVLTRAGFVVLPSDARTFAELYTDPRTITYPVFISADSILHVSRLLLDGVLRSTEQDYLFPELAMLEREMFDLSWAQYEGMLRLTVTPQQQRMTETALRNASYFAVALSLLDPTFTPPDVISPVVNAELSLIAASAAITVSPLLDLPGVPPSEKLQIDYGQFTPVGHYGSCVNCAWDAYYRAMTWHRLAALRPSQREETRSAALIAYTMQTNSAPRVLWQRIFTPLTFFQGKGTSFTPSEYGDLLTDVWGEMTSILDLADEEKMDAFILAIQDVPLPDNPMWTLKDKAKSIDRRWRFLGQPDLIDSYIFEQMVWDYVGDLEDPRQLPSSVDLAAVLGSLEAYRVSAEVGNDEYAHYVEQVDQVRNELDTLGLSNWTEDLYWNWLHVYRALLREKGPSYPEWMRTTSWKRKELQATFGSWTSVRHDSPAVVEFVAAQPPEAESRVTPPWGYVEPQPEVYARLAALTRMIIDGLEGRMMLSGTNRDALLELETWLVLFQEVARRELTGQALSEQEVQRMAGYGDLVERLTRQALSDGVVPGDQVLGGSYEEAVVLGVAASEKDHLIEATGWVDEIYVVIERGRVQYLARGGVYSHYEFAWPIQEPLTDEIWRLMLAGGQTPPRPEWTDDFVIPR